MAAQRQRTQDSAEAGEVPIPHLPRTIVAHEFAVVTTLNTL